MGVSWTDEQRQAIDNRGGTLLVSAAAGSGKTAVLVQRVLDRVTDSENPCDVDSFLIVTFTKAAASEMRGKIADALTELAAKQPQNLRLRRQLMLVHRAKITTVHAFCMSLVKEHFHELGLPPEFRTADDSEQTAMQQEVLEEVLEAQYAVDGAGFSALVEAVSGGRDDRQLASLVLETFRNLQSSPKPKKELEQYRQKFVQEFDRIANTDWGMALLQEADSRIQYSIAALEDALDEMNGADVVQDKYEPVFAHDKQQAENLLALVRDGAWDAAVQLCAQLRGSFKRIPAIRGYEDKDFLEQLKNRRNIWKDMVKEMADKVLCVTEQEVREDMHMMAPAVCALCDTVQLFMDAYQAEKLRRGVVDFNDLEHFAVQLLVDENDAPTQLAREMHFSEIMVDEYQDTNAVQDAIFRAVSDDEKNLFMVGDVKQSIYRFRLANPDIFLHKYQSYRDAEAVSNDAPRRVVLSKNFRSRPAVLDSVNYLFSALMSEDLGDLEYTDREALRARARHSRREQTIIRRSFVCWKPNRRTKMRRNPFGRRRRIGANRVRGMLDEGFRVTDKQTGQLRPCRAGDFVVLLRSAKNKASVFQQELIARGIPAGADAAEDMFGTPRF